MKHIKPLSLLYGAWVIAIAAFIGSLYFSDALHFAPCVLCWYQRVAMYPLVLLIPIGIMRKDNDLPYYCLALAIAGLLVAFYQTLLYYHVIPERVAPCSFGVSCTTKYIEWFGFVSIPLLSLLGFILIVAGMIYIIRQKGSIYAK